MGKTALHVCSAVKTFNKEQKTFKNLKLHIATRDSCEMVAALREMQGV